MLSSRRSSSAHDASTKLEEEIRSVFYNLLAQHVLNNYQELTEKTLPKALISGILAAIALILEQSKHSHGIVISSQTTITSENCPDSYANLFHALLSFKAEAPTLSEQQAFAESLMQLDSFKKIDPSQFLLEAFGLTPTQLTGVTPTLIRETFYNEMIMQGCVAVENQWLTRKDLDEQEFHIYFALPALTCLEAIQQSHLCEGIRLLNGKILTNDNCPKVENFPELTALILSAKPRVLHFNPTQLQAAKHLLSSDNPLPDSLQPLQTVEFMASVTVIRDLAIEISRKMYFKTMLTTVLQFCTPMIEEMERTKAKEKAKASPASAPHSAFYQSISNNNEPPLYFAEPSAPPFEEQDDCLKLDDDEKALSRLEPRR